MSVDYKQRLRAQRVHVLLGTLLAIIACGDDEVQCPISIPRAGCNVFEDSCRQLVFQAAQCEREGKLGAEPPPVQVVEAASLEEEYRKYYAAQTQTPEEEHWQKATALLGLIEPVANTAEGRAELRTEGLLGFYTPGSKRIVLVKHETGGDDFRNALVLAHEYIHALQDREFDLEAFSKERFESFDSTLAARAVIEGEARLFEGRAVARAVGRDPDFINWEGQFSTDVDVANRWLSEQGSPLAISDQVFPYTYGAQVSAKYFAEGQRAGLAEFRSLPELTALSVMQEVHGARSNAGSVPAAPPASDNPVSANPASSNPSSPPAPGSEAPPVDSPEALPTPFESSGSYQLGAWGLHVFLFHNLGASVTPDLALDWMDDRFQVFYRPMPEDSIEPAPVLADWSIRFENELAAQELTELVAGPHPNWHVIGMLRATRIGTTVHLVVSQVDTDISAFTQMRELGPLAEGETQDKPFARRTLLSVWEAMLKTTGVGNGH